jgi:hypothetical protein
MGRAERIHGIIVIEGGISMSPIKTNIQIVSFGHAVITLGPSAVQLEPSVPHSKEIYYQEPVETASFFYEISYKSQEVTYITPPLSTTSSI